MKVSCFISQLERILKTEGDLNIYCGDMGAPQLQINKTIDEEDVEIYGETYLSIEEAEKGGD